MGINGFPPVGWALPATHRYAAWMSAGRASTCLGNPPEEVRRLYAEPSILPFQPMNDAPVSMTAGWNMVGLAPTPEDFFAMHRQMSASVFQPTDVPNAPPEDPMASAKLRRLGLSGKTARELLDNLKSNKDGPYHAGRLWNGKTYLLTRNDTVYYGWPNHMQKMGLVEAGRTRCPDRQTRWMKTDNGISFRVERIADQQTTAVTMAIPGVGALPVPQFRQATFAV